MPTDNQTVDSFMRNIVEANLLKYATSHAIFCPVCQTIMDWKKTAVVSLYASLPGQEDKMVKTYVQCCRCYDRRKPALEGAIADTLKNHPDWLARFEVVDGREARFKGKR